ncbi:ROK family protein [Streptomyces sp. NPDC059832]|uniref:ROK family transcriptional regulator n=1 Tax=Streptomyces sp. NPDC059832 TaxID=3346966 RepID=UPI00364EDFA1
MTRRAARSGLVRAVNDRLALDLLVEYGPLSRSALADRTGMSKPSVAELIDRLLDAGLIEETGIGGVGRRGPNARLYGLVHDRAFVAGAEVRGGEVTAVITGIGGRAVAEAAITTRPRDNTITLVRDAVVAAAADGGADLDRLHGVVVGTPGIVDPRSGEIGFAADLPTWGGGLRDLLRRELAHPVRFENEVNLSALAEHRVGAARGQETFALISLGEGVGMALMLDGRLVRGASGGAGEIGYLPLGDGALAPVRPAEGTYAGGFQALAGARAVRSLARQHGFDRRTATAAVRAAHAAGEGGAAFLDALVERVAAGVAAVCTVVDPGLVVLTGPLGRVAGELLGERLAERVGAATPVRPEVRPSSIEGNPVLRGAVLSALDAARDEVFGPTLHAPAPHWSRHPRQARDRHSSRAPVPLEGEQPMARKK